MLLEYERRTRFPTRRGNIRLYVEDDGQVYFQRNDSDPPPGAEWTHGAGEPVKRLSDPARLIAKLLDRGDKKALAKFMTENYEAKLTRADRREHSCTGCHGEQGRAAADGYYPARVAFRRALQEGAVPTWEPGAFAGWPLLADPYYGWFYPLNFVFYLGRRAGEPDTGPAAGIPAGLGLSVALHTLLGGIGTRLAPRLGHFHLVAPKRDALEGAILFARTEALPCLHP